VSWSGVRVVGGVGRFDWVVVFWVLGAGFLVSGMRIHWCGVKKSTGWLW